MIPDLHGADWVWVALALAVLLVAVVVVACCAMSGRVADAEEHVPLAWLTEDDR